MWRSKKQIYSIGVFIVNVLFDMEWVQKNEVKSITQLAAIRVTEEWKTVDGFERLVRPTSGQGTDWAHMAYSGYSPDEFRSGVDENACIAAFFDFLRDDDTLLCWHKDTRRLLKQKCEQYIGKPLPIKCTCMNEQVYLAVRDSGIKPHGLYEVAGDVGLTTPVPRHQSANDVGVMRDLLSELECRVKSGLSVSEKIPKKKMTRRERNADILSRVQYNYIFTPASKVFHRPTCHLVLNARDIMGCVYYKKAIKGRVPCKICHPEPIAPQLPSKTNSETEQEKAAQPKPPERKSITARLLGNRWVTIANDKIVGFCHNVIHPGKLTRKIMEEHDCVGKKCRFFEKYADSSYWVAEENRKIQKQQRKQAQQAEKLAAQKLKDELDELKNLFQSYADDAGYIMHIVRLEKERPNRYKVFYVSENPFADGNRFPDFLSTVRFFFPRSSIQLRHIRDVDGHFVTITEFLARKK